MMKNREKNVIPKGCHIVTGETLRRKAKEYEALNQRNYVTQVVKRITDAVSENLKSGTVLHGAPGTGKTVSIWHMIDGLLKCGIESKNIAYILLEQQNEVTDRYTINILGKRLADYGVEYLFVDELPYVKEIVDIGSIFDLSMKSIVVTGRYSTAFQLFFAMEVYEYDVEWVHCAYIADYICTTWISPEEYIKLYPCNGWTDYIRYGGLLHEKIPGENEYEKPGESNTARAKKYRDRGLNCLREFIVADIQDCSERYDKITTRKQCMEVPDWIEEKAYFGDAQIYLTELIDLWCRFWLRELADKVIRRTFESLAVSDSFRATEYQIFGEKLLELERQIRENDAIFLDIFERDEDIRLYLRISGCICEESKYPRKEDKVILMKPIAIPYGCLCEIIQIMEEHFDLLRAVSGLPNELEELAGAILFQIESVLQEEIEFPH